MTTTPPSPSMKPQQQDRPQNWRWCRCHHVSISAAAISALLVIAVFYADAGLPSLVLSSLNVQFSGSVVDPTAAQHSSPPPSVPGQPPLDLMEEEPESSSDDPAPPKGCDIFTGSWVYDADTRPLYREEECGFLTSQVTCGSNGRKDERYQKWRWQPHGCDLPRFHPRRLLERLRGKRLMFVGDSLNRNQWESLVCLLQGVEPPGHKSLVRNGSLSVFRVEDYNATVEFYWAPFLVESNSDNPKIHSIRERIVMPESIDTHGANWVGVDYLVFNTYIWWMNTIKMKVLRGSFAENSTEYDEVDRWVAYDRVLRTWAGWVDRNVDPNRTALFFVGSSPIHMRSTDWGSTGDAHCALETDPILPSPGSALPPYVGTDRRFRNVAINVTASVRAGVDYLDITAMSEYRKDAHTAVYTIRQGKVLSPEQQADPATYADCIHWCLPGLPDVWNELLYARIMARAR